MKRFFKILPVIIAAIGLSSCLKDESIISSKPSNIVEFLSTSAVTSDVSSPYPFYVESFSVLPTGQFQVFVNYSGTDNAPQDINIEVALAPDALTKINTPIKKDAYDAAYAEAKDADYTDEEAAEYAQEVSDAAGYTLIPTDIYSLSTLKVVIKKGQRKSEPITVNVKPDKFDFALKYGLPLTIKSTSFGNLSGNFATVIYNIGAKNAYDGTYNHKYTSSLGNGTNSVDLVTVDANSVSLDPGLLGVYSNYQTLTVDPATNKVTVYMESLLPIGNTGPSTWDPATKTIHVKWTSNGGARNFDETYTYTGAR